MKTKNITTPHLRNSINPLPWRYGFFLIALVCLALSPTANNVSAGTVTLRSGLVFSGHPISTQLTAQGSQENHHQPVIIIFDAPGSAPPGTQPQTINQDGAIAGGYTDASTVIHGFLRARNGTFTTFDAPGAGTSPGQGTLAGNINLKGEIAGDYQDASNVFHAFVRAPGGTITTFDAPGAGTGAFQGTTTASDDGLNSAGAVTGSYFDGSNVGHGFVRAPGGSFTTFDVPGAGTGPGQGTFSGGINQAETVGGTYVDGSNVNHGFVRARNSTITKFDVPGAGTGAGQGTQAQSINDSGVIDGFYNDASGVAHGFVRARNGAITTFDAPCAGTGAGQGTAAFAINSEGEITGFYLDYSNVFHGFLRSPCDKDHEDAEACD